MRTGVREVGDCRLSVRQSADGGRKIFASSLYRLSQMFSHPFGLLAWGAMKMAFEIPAELGRTGIADF